MHLKGIAVLAGLLCVYTLALPCEWGGRDWAGCCRGRGAPRVWGWPARPARNRHGHVASGTAPAPRAPADLAPVASASTLSHSDALGPTVDQQWASSRVGLKTDDGTVAL